MTGPDDARLLPCDHLESECSRSHVHVLGSEYRKQPQCLLGG